MERRDALGFRLCHAYRELAVPNRGQRHTRLGAPNGLIARLNHESLEASLHLLGRFGCLAPPNLDPKYPRKFIVPRNAFGLKDLERYKR
jgi:hypothetical protein